MFLGVLLHRLETEDASSSTVRIRVGFRDEELVDLLAVLEEVVWWESGEGRTKARCKEKGEGESEEKVRTSSRGKGRDASVPPLERRQEDRDSPKHIDDPRKLVVLARSREKRQSEEEFDGDASEGPHVDRRRVRETEKDFWRPVESRLDVGVDGRVLVAGGSEVDDFDVRGLEAVKERAKEGKGGREESQFGASSSSPSLVREKEQESNSRLQQDVLGLQIAMDQPRLVQDREGIEELGREDLDELGAESSERVLLDEFVEVGREALEDEAEVLAVDEVGSHSEDVVGVVRVAFGVELQDEKKTKGKKSVVVSLSSGFPPPLHTNPLPLPRLVPMHSLHPESPPPSCSG